MTGRAAHWIGGAAVGIVLAIIIPWPEFRAFGLLLGWLGIGLLGEAILLVREFRDDGPIVPSDSRPADGVVEIEAVAALRSVPDPVDGRFRRLTGFEPIAAAVGPTTQRRRSRPPLLGKVVIASIFLGRDGGAWSDAEIAKAHAALIRAGEWIERQAKARGASVNLSLADTYIAAADDRPREAVAIDFVSEGRVTVPDEAEPDRHVLGSASHAVARLGLGSFVDVCQSLHGRIDADAVVWLVHVRASGRSRAIDEAVCGVPGINLAVCHAREDDFPGPLQGPPFPDPITFVHELLHLFGATDKYGMPLGDFPLGSVTGRDVMRLDVESLARLRVDPLTAREIGWGPDPGTDAANRDA